MGYTLGIVVEYQYQGAGIGIVLLIVKYHHIIMQEGARKRPKLCISKNTNLVKQDIDARTPSP
jgi:hypothetical protein